MERIWLISYGAAWGLTVAQALALAAVAWALGRVHMKRAPEAYALITDEGPGIHARLPEVGGLDTAGRLVSVDDYRGSEVALLLMSPECSPCEELAHGIRAVRRGMPEPPAFLVILEAGRDEAEAYRRRHRLSCRVIADEAGLTSAALGIGRTPYGLLIDKDGITRMKGVVNNRMQLEGMIGRRGRRFGGLDWQASSADGERVPRSAPAGAK